MGKPNSFLGYLGTAKRDFELSSFHDVENLHPHKYKCTILLPMLSIAKSKLNVLLVCILAIRMSINQLFHVSEKSRD